eukprot:scaffold568_cov160-Amphora_coffeaeformis.AAC.10
MRKYNTQEVESWRYWMFGDVSPTTHQFVENAIRRAPKEVACAAAASSLVSPLVSIIDKCIVQDISGTSQFLRAVGVATADMVKNPRVFFGGLSFRFTWFVYFGTFATANLSELGMDVYRIRRDEQRKQVKVAASGVANIGLLAWRDSVFAREFGSGKAPASTPFRTIGLFAFRDMATMYATFYTAPQIARYIRREYGVERNTAELSCALGIPALAQILTAPLHIHAMDYYNVRSATLSERWATIRREFGTVSFARGVRILPAFGIGSFSNNKFREFFIRQANENLLLSRRVTVALETVRRRTTNF